MAPRTRSSGLRPDLKSSVGSSSTSNTLAPAASPCCSGPSAVTSVRMGAVVSSSAVRKPQNSPTVISLSIHLHQRHPQHAAEPQRRDELHHRIAGRLRGDELHVAAAVVLVDGFEVARFLFLRVEHLDDALAVERFLGDARDVAHRGLDARAVAAERFRHLADEPRQRRREDQHEQRQLPVEREQPADLQDDGQRIADQRAGGVGGGLGHLLDVEREPRQHRAGRLPVVVPRGEMQVLAEQVARASP